MPRLQPGASEHKDEEQLLPGGHPQYLRREMIVRQDQSSILYLFNAILIHSMQDDSGDFNESQSSYYS
jgi:hypothetical protein